MYLVNNLDFVAEIQEVEAGFPCQKAEYLRLFSTLRLFCSTQPQIKA